MHVHGLYVLYRAAYIQIVAHSDGCEQIKILWKEIYIY
jgi:hypothetical protein